MGRASPLGIEGTGLSFRDVDERGRLTTAMARAKDEQGDWQVKRFPVESWHRDGSPVVPEAAKDWARATRKTFVREQAVARAATFQDHASLLIENLRAAGIGPGRLAQIAAVAKNLGEAGVTDMRRDNFPARVREWITGLKTCWSMPPDAPNRRLNSKLLSPATRNSLLIICKQVVGLAVQKRRLSYNPLDEIPRFKEAKVMKALFSVAELRQLVSDECRDHAIHEHAELESMIQKIGGHRLTAIKEIASDRGCHFASIYNRLNRQTVPDPWWLACCLLVYTGMRADEGINLQWNAIKWDEGYIHLQLTDAFHSKSDAERLVPLEPELRTILQPIAQLAGFILPAEIRAGGSGHRITEKGKQAKGARDYTDAFRRYMHRIGMDPGERTAHSLRHNYITLKMAHQNTNIDRLRKAVGHADLSTTQGYSEQSQLFQSEVDRWPDPTLWLRREPPKVAKTTAGGLR